MPGGTNAWADYQINVNPTKNYNKKPTQNPYAMLKSELDDFMPTTPKKLSRSTSSQDTFDLPPIPKLPILKPKRHSVSSDENQPPALHSSQPISEKPILRTTREKKEILGNYLGNVDALVEGVEKAGVFGLS